MGGQCDPGWKYDVWKKRCIKYFKDKSNFEQAHKICDDKGDVMPTVEDNNDAGFFRLLIQTNSKGKTNEAWVPLTGDDQDLTKLRWRNVKCTKKYSSFCARKINRNYMKMD